MGLVVYNVTWAEGRGLPPYQVESWSIQPFGHNTPTSQTRHMTDRTDNGPIASATRHSILIRPAVCPQQTWAENWKGMLCPFLGGAGSSSNTMSWSEAYTSVASGIFIHPAIWPKQTWAENRRALVPLLGELSPHLTQCCLGRGLPSYQVESWSIQPFGHNTPTTQTRHMTDRTENGPVASATRFTKSLSCAKPGACSSRSLWNEVKLNIITSYFIYTFFPVTRCLQIRPLDEFSLRCLKQREIMLGCVLSSTQAITYYKCNS